MEDNMLVIEELNSDVVSDFRDAGYDDDTIKMMSPREAFNLWLTWNGIVGYSDRITAALDSIRHSANSSM